jgi:hypothetical protein
MPAARTSLLTLLLGITLCSFLARPSSAQTVPDVPTGGTISYTSVEPDRPVPQVEGGTALNTVVTRIQSRVYLYRWMTPMIRWSAGIVSRVVRRDHAARWAPR